MAKLIVIQGMSGVGKTTLAKRLATDLGVACLSKDDIKEFLLDAFGVRNAIWAQVTGQASAKMLYDAASQVLKAGKPMIIENTFPNAYAPQEIAGVLAQGKTNALEIFCYTDDETRIKRIRMRIESGERHPGHIAQDEQYLHEELVNPLAAARIRELNIGRLIRFDTSAITDENYNRLLSDVRKFLEQA